MKTEIKLVIKSKNNSTTSSKLHLNTINNNLVKSESKHSQPEKSQGVNKKLYIYIYISI